MKYGIWKFVFTDEHSFQVRIKLLDEGIVPAWLDLHHLQVFAGATVASPTTCAVRKRQIRRMKDSKELGFWKIQHRICLGGNATCETYQTTSPSNDHSFKAVFSLEKRLVGVMIIIFVVQFCGVWKCLAKLHLKQRTFQLPMLQVEFHSVTWVKLKLI